MTYVLWAWRAVFWTFITAFFHYTLPQHDVARITDTYEKRVDFGNWDLFWSNSASVNIDGSAQNSRDVFFIQSFRTDDAPMIYRNEDTGWGWPPYFKFDTANLQAEASDLISKKTDDVPQWVMIRHYGWRNEFMSIYPNAVKIWAIDSPEERVIPWFNILIIVVSFAMFWAVRVRLNRFWERRFGDKDDP